MREIKRETLITCRKCGQEKEPQDFYRDVNNRALNKSSCIECLKEYNRAAYYIKQGREVPAKRARQMRKAVKRELIDERLEELERRAVYGVPMSQVEIARHCGVTKQAISMIERKARRRLAAKLRETLRELEV